VRSRRQLHGCRRPLKPTVGPHPKRMSKTSRTVRQRYILWRNNLHFQISFRRSGWFFEAVLNESLKPFVKTAKGLLTLVGLFSAFITFQSLIVSFLFGLVVYVVSTIFERVVFSYSSLYVHALPEFKLEPDKWLGAFFGHAETAERVEIPMVGWLMADAEYAAKVHDLLLKWSFGELRDEQKNISASAIVDGTDYVFFCYPSLTRMSAKAFHAKVERERKQTSPTDVHQKMFAMLIFGKRCAITPGSYFPTFRARYREGVPYIFRLALLGEGGQPLEIPGLKDFILFDLKIKDKKGLTRKDIEYDHLRIRG